MMVGGGKGGGAKGGAQASHFPGGYSILPGLAAIIPLTVIQSNRRGSVSTVGQ